MANGILDYTQLGIPAYNFAKSLVLGPSQPYISDTMQNQLIQRAKETELDKGSLGYEAFGLPVANEGGRFSGGLFNLALKDPVSFANVGSVGRVSFEKDPNAPGGYRFGDTIYDFTPDKDTGSTGSAILDFINRGGVKSAVEDFFFAPAYAPEPTEKERQSIEMGIMNPELTRKFDKSPAPLGMIDRLKGGLGSIRDTVTDKLGSVGDFITGGGIIGSALKGLDNMFEYRGGIGYVDEDGVFRSADELDRLNARGGYYTDAARASRRRDASIQRMLQRRAEGKRIGEQRLKDLLELQAKEEAARQAEFDRLNAIRQQRDAGSMSGGPGETTQGTFGSSVNDPSTFSDYS